MSKTNATVTFCDCRGETPTIRIDRQDNAKSQSQIACLNQIDNEFQGMCFRRENKIAIRASIALVNEDSIIKRNEHVKCAFQMKVCFYFR